jgi:hypothetical protein
MCAAAGSRHDRSDAPTLPHAHRLALSSNRPVPGTVLRLSVTVSPLRTVASGTAVVGFSTGRVTVRLSRTSSVRLAGAVRVPARARSGRVSVSLRVHTTAGLILAATRSAVVAAPRPASPTPTPSPSPTLSPTPGPGSPQVGGCEVLPADNVWNEPVSGLPVAGDSSTLIASIGASTGLHPDFGSYAGYGIPFNLADASTPRYTIPFTYAGESDPGPYPVPASPAIEAGSDAHLLVVDTATCTLYETWDTAPDGKGGWTAGSGAIWSLRSNALRPDGWTSGDAAGLPILPGLVRYDEVAAGFIGHAIRFTAVNTRNAHIYPARHDASSNSGLSVPPMGLRVRLKASYDISGLPSQALVIAQAMQTYGLILADNGSNWYFQGASDPRFSDDQLNALKGIPGSAFEAVDTTGFVNGP